MAPSFFANGNSGSSFTIDWSKADAQSLILTADCAISFINNPAAGAVKILQLIQDITGGRSAFLPPNVRFPGGVNPDLSAIAGGKASDLVLFYDGITWYGTFSLDYTPFNPNFYFTDIDGCLACLDASDPASLVSSGGLISQWLDKSGNGNHAAQSNDLLKPTLVEDFLDGSAVVEFNNPNRLFFTSTVDGELISTDRAFTVVTVLQQKGAMPGTYYAPYFQARDQNGNYLDFAFINLPSEPIIDSIACSDGGGGVWSKQVYAPVGADIWNSWINTYNGNDPDTDGNFSFQKNGTLVAQDPSLQIGAGGNTYNALGGAGTSTSPEAVNINGRMALHVIYDHVLTSDEMLSVNALIASKWPSVGA